MSGSLDTSDILVVIDKGDEYNVNLQPPDQYGISIKSGDTYIVNIDLPTTIAATETDTYYRVADFALTALTASYVSGAATSTDWNNITNKPVGLVSASQQVSYTGLSNVPVGILSSSTQINQLSNVTASFALTASYVSGAASTWDDISNKPEGLISSSVQINTGSFSGSFTGELIGTSSWALNAITSSFSTTASAATSITFVPATASFSVSSSIAVTSSFAAIASSVLGTVDSASYALNADLFDGLNSTIFATTGSNTFTGVQTISNDTNSTLWNNGALIVAGGVGVEKDVNISGSLTVLGLLTAVSMSTQYVTSSQYTIGTSRIILNDDDLVRFAGISIVDSGSTSPATASIYWDSLNHKFIYENLSGSAYNSAIFIAGPTNAGALGNEVGLTIGRIPVASDDDHIDSRPASSSIRVDFPSRRTHIEAGLTVTGSVSGSFTGSFLGNVIGTSSWASNAISSSFTTTSSFSVSSSRATTSSFALTASFVTTTVASASYALNADTLDGINSTTFATTGSNTFNGNQTITGSLFTNADTLIFTGSIFTSGSLSVTAGSITGSLFGTASRATTASYALTASFIDGGFY